MVANLTSWDSNRETVNANLLSLHASPSVSTLLSCITPNYVLCLRWTGSGPQGGSTMRHDWPALWSVLSGHNLFPLWSLETGWLCWTPSRSRPGGDTAFEPLRTQREISRRDLNQAVDLFKPLKLKNPSKLEDQWVSCHSKHWSLWKSQEFKAASLILSLVQAT